MDKSPRVERVTVTGPTTLRVKWRNGGTGEIVLSGWIATGGEILAALKNPDVFARAHVDDYGASVAWDDDGDLRIDAIHLELLALEQRKFGAKELAQWQDDMGLSNAEAAALLDVAVSTWNAYKAEGNIPTAIAMLCRVIQRDPLLMQAHYRPSRPAGRPKQREQAPTRARKA